MIGAAIEDRGRLLDAAANAGAERFRARTWQHGGASGVVAGTIGTDRHYFALA
jgi:hypothetical protein